MGDWADLGSYQLRCRHWSGVVLHGAVSRDPHPGDLTQVSATIALPAGAVSTSWKYSQNGSSFLETITAPQSVAGRYGIPTGGKPIAISIDGQPVWSACQGGVGVSSSMTFGNISLEGNYVYLSSVAGVIR